MSVSVCVCLCLSVSVSVSVSLWLYPLQVILMDSTISAYSAYSLMAANEQQSVPVWDSRADRYCGTLTTTDLLQLILLCSGMQITEVSFPFILGLF